MVDRWHRDRRVRGVLAYPREQNFFACQPCSVSEHDGDGDRIGVIDGEGVILWADQLLALFAREVLADHPGATKLQDEGSSLDG